MLRTTLDAGGAHLDGLYYCPHHPTAGAPPYRQACECRKPKPGMLLRAARELSIDLDRSWVVGDRHGDLQLAWSVGARAALVKTGYGRGELDYHSAGWSRQPDLVAEHLLEAVERILWTEDGR
jgi:D-glycero-D-manno-heptose 1,7-bisphosphate phosphatase